MRCLKWTFHVTHSPERMSQGGTRRGAWYQFIQIYTIAEISFSGRIKDSVDPISWTTFQTFITTEFHYISRNGWHHRLVGDPDKIIWRNLLWAQQRNVPSRNLGTEVSENFMMDGSENSIRKCSIWLKYVFSFICKRRCLLIAHFIQRSRDLYKWQLFLPATIFITSALGSKTSLKVNPLFGES